MGNLFDKEDFDGEVGGPEPEPEMGQDSVAISEADSAATDRKEGWLMKQGHLVKNWKRRWFVLEWPELKYYKNPEDASPKGVVLCDEVTLSERLGQERTGKEHCIMVHHPDRKIYYLQAENEGDMMSWVKAIRNERKVGLIDFEELSMIGKGNFGLVKLVRQKGTQRLYAMKVLRKDAVIKRKDVEHTKTERNVLRRIRHPFVVQLRFAFQTGNKLYMVMDYVQGGDLYFHLRQHKKFAELVVKVWIAELILAYGYLHDLGVVFRDLKPENLLLDADGHLHLADFGLSKQVESADQQLHTFCGTPYYLAPEIVNVTKQKGYGKDVDWWAIGVLLFELLTGSPPFQGSNLRGVYKAIVTQPHSRLVAELRKHRISEPAQQLITDLLNRNAIERLGAGIAEEGGDSEAVKGHAFFADLNWVSFGSVLGISIQMACGSNKVRCRMTFSTSASNPDTSQRWLPKPTRPTSIICTRATLRWVCRPSNCHLFQPTGIHYLTNRVRRRFGGTETVHLPGEGGAAADDDDTFAGFTFTEAGTMSSPREGLLD